jgi:hypothetical protein
MQHADNTVNLLMTRILCTGDVYLTATITDCGSAHFGTENNEPQSAEKAEATAVEATVKVRNRARSEST